MHSDRDRDEEEEEVDEREERDSAYEHEGEPVDHHHGDDDGDEEEEDEERQAREEREERRARARGVPRTLRDGGGGYVGPKKIAFIAVFAVGAAVLFLAAFGTFGHRKGVASGVANGPVPLGQPAVAPSALPTIVDDPLSVAGAGGAGHGGGSRQSVREDSGDRGVAGGGDVGGGGSGIDSHGGGVGVEGGATTPRVMTAAEQAVAERAARHAAALRGSSTMSLEGEEAGSQIAATDPAAAAVIAQQLAQSGGFARGAAAAASAASGAVPAAPAAAPPMVTGAAMAPSVGAAASGAPVAPAARSLPAAAPVQVAETVGAGEGRDREAPGYEAPSSEYAVEPGSIVQLVLSTDVNSDLPGEVVAYVAQPVYDSRTHSVEVIPPGTWVTGQSDGRVAGGQTRLLIGFDTFRFPDGTKFYMGTTSASDSHGASGLAAQVDNHAAGLFRNAFLLGVLGAGATLLTPGSGSVLNAPSVGSQVTTQVGAQIANTGTQIVQRGLQQAPTLRVSSGQRFDVLVTRELALRPWASSGAATPSAAPSSATPSNVGIAGP